MSDFPMQSYQALIEPLEELHQHASRLAEVHSQDIATVADSARDSATNLLHYLGMRQHDLRNLQKQLARLGLSSLGRMEGHAIDSIERILSILYQLTGSTPNVTLGSASVDLDAGERLLRAHTIDLFGEPSEENIRIMVTMPSEASQDKSLIERLVLAGMQTMRINCAHDEPDDWLKMIAFLREAESKTGRRCRIYADLAGPKIRTGMIQGKKKFLRLKTGEHLFLTRPNTVGHSGSDSKKKDHESHPPSIPCTFLEAFETAKPGERIFFDDGRIGGIIQAVSQDRIDVKITSAKEGGAKLREEKGINFPDTNFTIPALTDKDLENLKLLCHHVDMFGLSFVRSPEDVQGLIEQLGLNSASDVGVVLKIETRQAFEKLPMLLLSAMKSPPVGVMVARGDLAVELGFDRLAEVQEEILWLCEAAHVPVIWATQVLETLAKKGLPSRAEVTDAAMSGRAECVMLNKGPHIVEATQFLANILTRMGAHHTKKRSMLRKLKISEME